jgi:hypothetical protein
MKSLLRSVMWATVTTWLRPIWHAFREVGVATVFVLLPVWGGAGISMLIQENPSLRDALAANTAKGDLFLLATGLMAPLMLYISINRRELPPPLTLHFPGGWFFQVCLTLLFGACTILFALKRAAEASQTTFHLNEGLLLKLSIWTYFLATAISIVVTTIKYRLDAIRIEDAFRDDTNALVSDWKRRHHQ